MDDRQSANPGRVKFTLDDGTVMFGTLERADSPTVAGTPLNKNTLFNSINSSRYACDLPSEAFELLTRSLEAVIPASGWTTSDGGYYTNQVEVSGILKVHEPILFLRVTDSSKADEQRDGFNQIIRAESFDGYVVFMALIPPEIDVPVRMVGV